MTDNQPRISFDNVLVADGMAWTLFGMGQQEGLLYTAQGEGFSGRLPSPKDRQAVLSLLLLFDKLVIHDMTGGTLRLPDLERHGLLEIIASDEPSTKAAPMKSAWKPTKTDTRPAPPVLLRRDLTLLQAYKPLIINRLMSRPMKFDSLMARRLGISRREYLSEFLDLSVNYITGNATDLQDNIIEQNVPAWLLNEIKKELFDFQSRGEVVCPTNVTLIVALLSANELAVIQELSAARGLGVATRYYTRIGTGSPRSSDMFSADPSQVPRSFGLVRSILHEEGYFFPRIESIAHALKLRKDPHLRAFKEQLCQFHVQLVSGDHDRLAEVRNEVKQAKLALERTGKWNLGLRWLTYLSVPAGLAECLLGGPPIIGSSLAVASAVGTAASTRTSKHNEWVLFGM